MPFRRIRLATACIFAAALRAQSPIQFHGLLQGRFTDQQGTPDRLEIRRARLIVMGDPITGLSYKFQADFAKSPYIIDASVAYCFSPAVTISAGQMKIPFSAESILNDLQNPPVSRSRAVLGLAPGRDTGVQGRDTGVQVSGSPHRKGALPFVEYTVGVFRGQTLISAPKVHYNATAARLVTHPAHGLSLAGDWYGSFSAPPHQQKRREELEGEYIRGPLTLRAEQIWARDGSLQRAGGYLLGARKISRSLELLARADWLTADKHKPNTNSVAYIASANYYLWNHVKVGWNIGALVDSGPKGLSSVMLAQVALYF